MATTLPAHVTDADLDQLQDQALRSHFASYQQKNFSAQNDMYDPSGKQPSVVSNAYRDSQGESID